MIADDSRVICQIGALRGETLARGVKAHDILLKAFARAFGGDSDVLLVCAGDGPLRGEAETLATGLGIASQTRFLGDIAEPWSLLHAADIFAMPSRFEGLSMALLEAISTGLPVVASDIPEIRAVCHGDGFLFCPVDNVAAFSDAFHTVLNDLSRYASAAEKGAVDVRRGYSIDICAGRYWDEFNVMLDRKSRQ
jgi:glycosyltransferase involved in cell wall biosynthesis